MSTDGSGASGGVGRPGTGTLPRNDPRQYDDLAGQWWRPDGPFTMLHWLAEARAALIPVARRPDAVLVDIGCGGGLLAPHVAPKGYRHVGVDLVRSAIEEAREHGVTPLEGDATALPLSDACADVVAAGELFEHLADWPTAVGEACRVLRPGGLLVLDTLNATWLSRLLAVRVAERLPGVPRGLHDPRLFVDHRELIAVCARYGVRLAVRGIRPAAWPALRWLARQLVPARGGYGDRGPGRPAIVGVPSVAVLYQGWGVKDAGGSGGGPESAGPPGGNLVTRRSLIGRSRVGPISRRGRHGPPGR